MEKYLHQLLNDIQQAIQNIAWPYANNKENAESIWDWISDEEEEKTAPRIQLEEWTGINRNQLPPEKLLSDDQVDILYKALDDLLEAYNCRATFIFATPTRIRYEVIQRHFKQEVVQKQWHMGFFELCFANKPQPDCLMEEGCHCAYFEEIRSNWVEEELTPEEERKIALDVEVQHIKKKYGTDFMKYYPFHLDPAYDDEYGNPYDYGFGEKDDEEEDDNWWRK